MNKLTTTLLIIVFLLVAGLGVWLYFDAQKAPEPVVQNNEEIVPKAEPLLLSVINNNVQIKESSDPQLKEVVEKSISVNEGTYIKTSLTGRATLESTDKVTTVIDKNSEFTIVSSAQSQSKIFLGLGNIWAKVQKVFGKGESYQVETNNAVITVRGTSFGVSYTADKKTIIYVTEGTVWIISINPLTKEPVGLEVAVNAGQKATITDGQPPLIQNISEADKKSDWYIYINGTPPRPEPKKPATTTSSTPQTPSPTPPAPTPPAPTPPTPPPPPVDPPAPQPALYSVTPSTLYIQQEQMNFSINGKNLQNSWKVFLDEVSIEFFVKDSNTIVATVPFGTKQDVYDVSVAFSAQQKLTLADALTVR